MLFGLFGCRNARYKVDYGGQKDLFTGAQDSYRAGETVTLYFEFIATDTSYSFYVDGKDFNPDYDAEKGYVLKFTMPEHDITVGFSSVNTMEYIPEIEEPVMLLDYFHETVATVGGDGYTEIVLYTCAEPSMVNLTVFTKEEGEEERKTEYLVPDEVLERCMTFIEENDLRAWNELEDAYSITGARIVCKFRDGEDYIRVSTEEMPENGKEILGQIQGILQGYIREEYKIG